MLLTTKGIVIRTTKYAESSLILEIFTLDKGVRSYIISGVRGPKSKTKSTPLQLMSLVEIVVYQRDDKDLNRIKEIQPTHIYTQIPFDFKRGAVGLFMIEIVKNTVKESSSNTDLFHFIADAFLWLDQCSNYTNLHLSFMLSLSMHLGFFPDATTASPDAPFFDLREGFFVSENSSTQFILDEEYSALLILFLNVKYTECHEIVISRSQRQILLEKLVLYFQLHLDYFIVPNTHQILKEVLG